MARVSTSQVSALSDVLARKGTPTIVRNTCKVIHFYKVSMRTYTYPTRRYGFPFDRHDWYVDRGGKEHRYVIDYYFNPDGPANAPSKPDDAHPIKFTTAIYVDVRPAVDDIGSLLDRLRMFPQRALAALDRPKFKADGIDPRTQPKPDATAAPVHSSASMTGSQPEATSVPPLLAEVDAKCKPLLEKLRSASTEDQRRSSTLALNYCMGRIACPDEAAAFMKILEANEAHGTAGVAGGNEEAAFERMTQCVAVKLRAAQGGPAGHARGPSGAPTAGAAAQTQLK